MTVRNHCRASVTMPPHPLQFISHHLIIVQLPAVLPLLSSSHIMVFLVGLHDGSLKDKKNKALAYPSSA